MALSRESLQLSRHFLTVALREKPLVAVDPGPRNMGYAYATVYYDDAIQLAALPLCPIDMYNQDAPRPINKSLISLTAIQSSLMGGYMAGRIGSDFPNARFLIEAQPPKCLTHTHGKTTRDFTCGIWAGLASRGITDIKNVTVCEYKRKSLGLLVHSMDKRIQNKEASVEFVGILIDMFPLVMADIKRTHDCADAFLLLASELVAVATSSREICKIIRTHLLQESSEPATQSGSGTCPPFSVLQLVLLLISLPGMSEEDFQRQVRSLQQNELALLASQHSLCSVNTVTLLRPSKRGKQMVSFQRGVTHVKDTEEENGKLVHTLTKLRESWSSQQAWSTSDPAPVAAEEDTKN